MAQDYHCKAIWLDKKWRREKKKKKKERKEKENGKNKGKYIREKAMAFVPQNGMVPGGKLEAEEKISA